MDQEGNFTMAIINTLDQIEPVPDTVPDGRRRTFPVSSWEMTWMNVKEKHSIILSGFTQVIALLMGRVGGEGLTETGHGVRNARLQVCLIWWDLFWWAKLTFPLCGGRLRREQQITPCWLRPVWKFDEGKLHITSALVLGQNGPKSVILQFKGCLKL